jgi:hypothetical protein
MSQRIYCCLFRLWTEFLRGRVLITMEQCKHKVLTRKMWVNKAKIFMNSKNKKAQIFNALEKRSQSINNTINMDYYYIALLNKRFSCLTRCSRCHWLFRQIIASFMSDTFRKELSKCQQDMFLQWIEFLLLEVKELSCKRNAYQILIQFLTIHSRIHMWLSVCN